MVYPKEDHRPKIKFKIKKGKRVKHILRVFKHVHIWIVSQSTQFCEDGGSQVRITGGKRLWRTFEFHFL